MLQLFCYLRSSAAYRIRIARNPKQVDHDFKTVNLPTDAAKARWLEENQSSGLSAQFESRL
ncbi:MAG: hypothetical protein CL693_06930 [Cellvibrionaceae bacterium]|nr:hypothetical protein [Cellvibrionaceae bacterium]